MVRRGLDGERDSGREASERGDRVRGLPLGGDGDLEVILVVWCLVFSSCEFARLWRCLRREAPRKYQAQAQAQATPPKTIQRPGSQIKSQKM